MKVIKVKKTKDGVSHGAGNTGNESCSEVQMEIDKAMSIGDAIAHETRKLGKDEEYQLEINGKNSGRILTRRK
ncbi:hypothetical protein LCGC14_0872640 [marine sediment metagenome]|uniref:Uncharacterized protein n=1 Tax=marine sediment metagenome TaxID=412755 RepID=A0A0F9RNU9_9ZZZZ